MKESGRRRGTPWPRLGRGPALLPIQSPVWLNYLVDTFIHDLATARDSRPCAPGGGGKVCSSTGVEEESESFKLYLRGPA